jgi:hypothetical protein
MPMVVIKVAVSFGKAPVVTTVVVSKISVAAPGLSYVTLRKITATHVRSIPHAMWSISTHRMGSCCAHRMRSTAPSTTATSHVCASASAASPSASTFVGDKGHVAWVTRKRWKTC